MPRKRTEVADNGRHRIARKPTERVRVSVYVTASFRDDLEIQASREQSDVSTFCAAVLARYLSNTTKLGI